MLFDDIQKAQQNECDSCGNIWTCCTCVATATLWCCNCKQEVEARLTDGKEIYPHRADLHSKLFYKCDECKSYVGSHGANNQPLGCIPSLEIKQLRMEIHEMIDPIWKSRQLTRKQVYRKLSGRLGYEFHTGNIKTVEEANKVMALIPLLIAKRKKNDQG